MSSPDSTGVQVGVAYGRLIKWENHPDGTPNKSKPPLEVWEKTSDAEPFRLIERRDPDGTDQCGA